MIMSRQVHFFCFMLFGALLFTSSCTKDLKLPSSGQKKKIALFGELVAGDSITIRGAQSLSLSTNDTRFELPSDLFINVAEGTNNIPLSGTPDDLSTLIFSIPYKTVQQAFSGRIYTVSGTHSTMGVATATVKMPAAFTATLEDTSSTLYNSTPVFKVSISIDDKKGERNFYVIEAVAQTVEFSTIEYPGTPFPIIINDTNYTNFYTRQTIYSNDPASEHRLSGTASRLNKRILFSDSLFRVNPYKTDIYIPVVTYPDSFVYYQPPKRTIVSVKSVSEDYYNFLKSYEQYEPVSGFNTSAPVRMDGNVQGGLGMVGGVYRHQFFFWIPTQ